MTMVETPTTPLTVAKLKALCVLNDLSSTGKKAELLERLLEAGVDKETLGIEVFDEETATFHSVTDESDDIAEKGESEEVEAEPVMLSLEDDDTMTPSVAETKPSVRTKASSTPLTQEDEPDDDILEGEILEADLIDDELPEEAAIPAPEELAPQDSPSTAKAPLTLREMLQRPQAVAVILTLLILGAGGWYYVNNQLEPFTADSLRYGDEMRYVVSEGSFMASDEYVTLITDQLNDIEEYCKMRLLFDGTGSLAITDGSTLELTTQPNEDRLGAVAAKGGQGMTWLAVESVNSFSFSKFNIYGHVPTTSVTGGQMCPDFAEGREGTADIGITRWTELREQATLSTQVDMTLQNTGGTYDGTAMAYGVGGLLGGLETLSPGLGLILQPVELADFFGNNYITNDATGTSSGWEWRVIGSEKIGSTNMWKVTASHRDIQDFCLGYATMNLWLDADSPWAARQTVDVAISSEETSRSSCSEWQKRGIDAALPEGELELHHAFERTYLQRGVKQIELGKSYDNRPQANDLNPDENDLVAWGVDEDHLPDNSTLRDHPLDLAMTCMDEFGSEASGATTALDQNGYVWRALNQKNVSATEWNISWVATDNTAGWVLFSVSGDASNLQCEYLSRGAYDDSVTHNRDSIPEVLPLEQLEARLMNQQRFADLTGEEALFTSTGLHDDTRVGYLVVVPGSGFGFDITDIFDSVTGATTVDMQRQWDGGDWDHTFSLLADGTDGRVVGWTHIAVLEAGS
jgi:hypothetical protein